MPDSASSADPSVEQSSTIRNSKSAKRLAKDAANGGLEKGACVVDRHQDGDEPVRSSKNTAENGRVPFDPFGAVIGRFRMQPSCACDLSEPGKERFDRRGKLLAGRRNQFLPGSGAGISSPQEAGTSSGRPPEPDATTGSPEASASITTVGQGSRYFGWSRMWCAR